MTTEVFDRAKVLNSDISEPLLSLYCDEAENYVVKYCRLNTLPEELYTITAQLAVSLAESADTSGISSMSEGGRSISYTNSSELLRSFEVRLRPFRDKSGKVPSEVVR